MSHYVIVEDQ